MSTSASTDGREGQREICIVCQVVKIEQHKRHVEMDKTIWMEKVNEKRSQIQAVEKKGRRGGVFMASREWWKKQSHSETKSNFNQRNNTITYFAQSTIKDSSFDCLVTLSNHLFTHFHIPVSLHTHYSLLTGCLN